MPEFQYNNKVYQTPVEFAMDRIGNTWKMAILWRLRNKVQRYGELKSEIPRITHKMLSAQLRELEKDGFISRKVYPVVPPKVEYSMTKRGKKAVDVVGVIRDYGSDLMKDLGIEQPRDKKNKKTKK